MKTMAERISILALVLAGMLALQVFASQMATDAFAKVNEIRRAHGLSEIAWDAQIEAAANVRASEQATLFSHTRPDGSDWYTANPDKLYGENLAQGYNDADSVVNAWMNSPEHRANILREDFTAGSISTYIVNGKVYWAQEFGYKD